MNSDTSAQRHRTALLWLTTAIGSQAYAIIQSFTYVNGYINAHGAAPAITFGAGALWAFAILCAIWVVPALLAIAGRSALADWGQFLVGGFLVLANSLGSIFDGIRDGGHITATALIAIALPGAVALRASWQLLRRRAIPSGLARDT